MSATWRIVYVEDEATYRDQVKEYLEGTVFAHGALSVTAVESFDNARGLLAERKVDLVILDVFAAPMSAHDAAGLGVLAAWKETGFAPVVLYTAVPKDVEGEASPFVEVVGKDAGLDRLLAAITGLFERRIPQTHRAVSDHIEIALRGYMWNFVAANWDYFQGIISQPEFLRLLLSRLALELGNNLQPLLERVYGGTHRDPAPETVHPAAYYVKPPVGKDPLLGDLRAVDGSLVFVMWPSCDMVLRGEACKVDAVLCARTVKVVDTPEYAGWKAALADGSEPKMKKARESLDRLCSNQRQGKGIQSERYHFLPKVWDIPALLVDMADLVHLPMSTLRGSTCLATVASPFAEAVSARFLRYMARIGTPDLDLDLVVGSL